MSPVDIVVAANFRYLVYFVRRSITSFVYFHAQSISISAIRKLLTYLASFALRFALRVQLGHSRFSRLVKATFSPPSNIYHIREWTVNLINDPTPTAKISINATKVFRNAFMSIKMIHSTTLSAQHGPVGFSDEVKPGSGRIEGIRYSPYAATHTTAETRTAAIAAAQAFAHSMLRGSNFCMLDSHCGNRRPMRDGFVDFKSPRISAIAAGFGFRENLDRPRSHLGEVSIDYIPYEHINERGSRIEQDGQLLSSESPYAVGSFTPAMSDEEILKGQYCRQRRRVIAQEAHVD